MIESIRPVLTSALNTHYGIVTKANETKANANKTLKDTVADLWVKFKPTTTPAAFRACVIQIALDAGYTDGKQWGTKILVKIDKESFQQRAERSDKGDKKGANARTAGAPPKALTDAQIKHELHVIRDTAKRLHLKPEVIEALVLAILHANDQLAMGKAA